jgi:hypothetical protein
MTDTGTGAGTAARGGDLPSRNLVGSSVLASGCEGYVAKDMVSRGAVFRLRVN